MLVFYYTKRRHKRQAETETFQIPVIPVPGAVFRCARSLVLAKRKGIVWAEMNLIARVGLE